jgi:hypothetical protein
MFMAALFTRAKLWKQSRALQLKNGLSKCDFDICVHTYNGTLFNHKEE